MTDRQDITVLFQGLRPEKRRFYRATQPTVSEIRDGIPDGLIGRPSRAVGKTIGGIYTCREDPRWPGHSPWASHGPYVREIGSRDPRAAIWRLRAPGVRLLTIDSSDDLADAYDRYPSDFLAGRGVRSLLSDRASWSVPKMPEIDHEAAAADGYDGFEVTPRGLRAWGDPRHPRWDVYWPLALVGWDVPTVLFYRWAFVGRPQRVTQEGHHVDESEADEPV
jgi:hypothetical protein